MCTRCLVKQKEDELSTQKALSAIGEAKMGRGLFFFCVENQLIQVSGVLQASRICRVELNSIEFNVTVSSTKVCQPIQTLSLIVPWLFSFWICCLKACAVNKKWIFIHYKINVCIWFNETEIVTSLTQPCQTGHSLSNLWQKFDRWFRCLTFRDVFNQIELSLTWQKCDVWIWPYAPIIASPCINVN